MTTHTLPSVPYRALKYLKKRRRLYRSARDKVNRCDARRFRSLEQNPDLATHIQRLCSGVYLWHEFLTPEQCGAIISLADGNLERSAVAGENRIKVSKHRTSLGYIIGNHELPGISEEIRHRLVELTQLPLENQEELKAIKYEPGQEYKIHHDCHLPLTRDEENIFLRQGGRRIFSCLIYLNDGFEGG